MSHLLLLVLFWGSHLLKLPPVCLCLQKTRLIGLPRG